MVKVYIAQGKDVNEFVITYITLDSERCDAAGSKEDIKRALTSIEGDIKLDKCTGSMIECLEKIVNSKLKQVDNSVIELLEKAC